MAEESVQRTSNTDFSIERILSEDTHRTEDSPSWLCCTRYRPPRIPRLSNSACRPRRAGRHARVPFTSPQAAALETAYSRSPYLAPPALRALAAALQLRDDRIKIWFQNRRARERREKCTNIAPPDDVTLPPSEYHAFIQNAFIAEQKNIPQTNQPVLQSLLTPEIIDIKSNYKNVTPENKYSSRSSTESRSESPLDVDTIE